jgi:CHAT domain-containing protein
VCRNLCVDWHRQEFGRHRVFESVSRLPALAQERTPLQADLVVLSGCETALGAFRPRQLEGRLL